MLEKIKAADDRLIEKVAVLHRPYLNSLMRFLTFSSKTSLIPSLLHFSMIYLFLVFTCHLFMLKFCSFTYIYRYEMLPLILPVHHKETNASKSVKARASIMISAANDTGNEDFNAYADKDQPAQHGRFPGKPGTEALADAKSNGTNDECYPADDETGSQGFCSVVFRNGEAYRQRIYGGRHAL